MDLSLATLIGFVAGTLASGAYVPQIWKCWRSGEAAAVSKRMFTLRAIGLVLWFVYGFGVGSLPVLVFSALSLGLSLTILILKARYTRRMRRAAA
ncbi:MAG TPA: PQ-loop domain-containing transporter [Microvirga sp.]|jgi:MtN3 and saliva related transmembrane protein|nr:PQ-loop domain-containing transporter [Microvirga sp.]